MLSSYIISIDLHYLIQSSLIKFQIQNAWKFTPSSAQYFCQQLRHMQFTALSQKWDSDMELTLMTHQNGFGIPLLVRCPDHR